jgi:DNA-binding NarL/FixJ family response regulator
VPELRILVADDHELVRRGIRALLEAEPGWKVVAEVSDGHEAIERAVHLKPEIAVLDISMPRLSGLEAARRIKKLLPQTKVLILTMLDSEHLAWEVLKAGARGYVTKSDTGRDLVIAIESVRRDKTFFTPRVDRILLDTFLEGKPAKSPKELDAARNCSASCRGQDQQGSVRRSELKRENDRDPPGEHHEAPQLPFGERSGPLRGSQSYHPGLALSITESAWSGSRKAPVLMPALSASSVSATDWPVVSMT